MASEEKCDIAVIGGGVIGLACAWRLAQGGAKVSLFERGTCGREASYAAAGMIAPLIEAARHAPEDENARRAMLDLCLQSRDLYADFVCELKNITNIDTQLQLEELERAGETHHGIVYVASRDNDPAMEVFSNVDNGLFQKSARFENSTSLQRLTRKIPLNSENQGYLWLDDRLTPCPPHWEAWSAENRVFWMKNQGQIDNRLLVEALKRASQKNGVKIYQQISIHEIGLDGQRVVSVKAGQAEYKCNQVIDCRGAWSGSFLNLPTECRPPVHPVKGEIIELGTGKWSVEQVVYSSDVYLVPRASGSLLVGATMVQQKDFGKSVTGRGVLQLLKNLEHLWPDLLKYPIKSTWAGLRPATPDGLPILGSTPMKNLFVATGHFRNGILLTPITAQLMADCLLNSKEPPSEFSLARFHQ